MDTNNRCNGDGVYLPEIECDDCSAIADQVTALDNAVDVLQTALASTNDNVTALQTAMTATQGNVTGLRTDLTGIQNDASALQAAVTSLTQRLTALETLIGNKQNTVLSMTDENDNVTTVTVLAE